MASNFDATYEYPLMFPRREERVLMVNSISFRVSPAVFKQHCLDRLSNGYDATFHWQPANRPRHLHRGFVMIVFSDTAERDWAHQELTGLRVSNRLVEIRVASRRATRPRDYQGGRAATTGIRISGALGTFPAGTARAAPAQAAHVAQPPAGTADAATADPARPVDSAAPINGAAADRLPTLIDEAAGGVSRLDGDSYSELGIDFD